MARLDVDDDVSVSDAFDKVLTEYGRIDILVNNAGIMVTLACFLYFRGVPPGAVFQMLLVTRHNKEKMQLSP